MCITTYPLVRRDAGAADNDALEGMRRVEWGFARLPTVRRVHFYSISLEGGMSGELLVLLLKLVEDCQRVSDMREAVSKGSGASRKKVASAACSNQLTSVQRWKSGKEALLVDVIGGVWGLWSTLSARQLPEGAVSWPPVMDLTSG